MLSFLRLVVISLAAYVFELIKTFTTFSFDTGPEFVVRANGCPIWTIIADLFAILREVAIQDVAVALLPTFNELLSFTHAT